MGTPCRRGSSRSRFLLHAMPCHDLDVVLGSDRHQSLHVGRLRRRYGQLLGRFAHFHGKLLEARRVVLQEYPGRLRSVHLEAVGYPARPVDERTRLGFHLFLSDVEGHQALHDVEGLALVAVHVVGRGEPAWHQVVNEAEGAAGLLCGRLHYHERAQKPHRRAFFAGQRVRLSAHIYCVPSFGWSRQSENPTVAESEVYPLYELVRDLFQQTAENSVKKLSEKSLRCVWN